MITPLRQMPKTDHPEEEFVLQAKAGSHAAFQALYRMHLGHVYGICMRILSDRSSAEELTQKIFIHAWRALNRGLGTNWPQSFAADIVKLTMWIRPTSCLTKTQVGARETG